MDESKVPASNRTVRPTDNLPPDPIVAMTAAGIAAAKGFDDRVAKLIEAANQWLKLCPVIQTEEEASKCIDLMNQLRGEWEAVEAERKARKKPLDDAVDAIHVAFKALLDKIGACGLLLKPLKDAWLTLAEKRQKEEAAEAKRKADQAALDAKVAADFANGSVESRLAADALAAQAETAAADAQRLAERKPQVAGSLGGRATGFTTVWTAKITDWPKAAMHYCNHAKVQAAIQREADADAKRLHEALKVDGIEAVKGRRV